jgi:hypothetical protein
LALPASVASAEGNFSVIKRMKSFNQSEVSEERLNVLSTRHMNSYVARTGAFSTIIEEFAKNKGRKECLN